MAGAPGMPGMAGAPGMIYGGEVNEDYHLCSNGTMMRKSASTGQVASQNMTIYGRGTNRERGRWHVEVSMGEPFLVMSDGGEKGFRLELDNDKFLLDGKPYTITASNQCK